MEAPTQDVHHNRLPFWERDHAWVITLGALALRLAVFFFILFRFGDAGFILPPFSDGYGYVTIGTNLLDGHGFSRSDAAPFLPDTKRVPLYPLYLAFTFALSGGALWLAALLQTLMSTALVLLAYKITDALAGTRAAFFAALCTAVYPFALFLSTQILAETLFTCILFGGFIFFIRFSTSPTYRTMLIGGVLMGLAALVKPAAQYIPFLLLPFIALTARGLQRLTQPLVYIICFLLVISPWIVRNAYESGVPTLSYEANILFDLHLAGYQSFTETGSAAHADQYRTVKSEDALIAVSRSVLVQRVFGVIVSDPVGFAKYLALTTVPFIFGDGFVTMVVALSPDPSIPAWDFSASGSALGRTIGFGVLPPWLLFLSIASKALWGIILVAAVFGFVRLMRSGGTHMRIGLAFALVIAYFMFAGGPVQSARYRQPVEPLIFICAGIGIADAYRRYAIHRRGRHTLPSATI